MPATRKLLQRHLPHGGGARFLLLISCLAAASGSTSAQEKEPAVDVVHLAGPVHMLRSDTRIGNPTTVVSAGPDGIFLVDPNLPSVGDLIKAELKKLGSGKVRFIACSHYHGDHAEGFENFAGEAIGIVPRKQRARLATGDVKMDGTPLTTAALPMITFDDRITLHFNGEEIDVFTPPNRSAHTDGDAFVYFKSSKVLYVGDHFFLGKFPIVDIEAGGDLEGYLGNMRYVLDRFSSDTIVVPGHGAFAPDPARAATMDEYAVTLAVLEESIELIRAAMATGRSLEEIQEQGLPERFAGFSARPRYVKEERWIAFIHNYYAGRP